VDQQLLSGGGRHRPGGRPARKKDVLPRPSTVDLAVCAWFVAAIVLGIAVALRPQDDSTYRMNLGIGVAALAFIGFGCWKIQSGKNCWRVFFTTLSVCCVVLVPFAAFGGNWDYLQRALGVLACVLVVTGLVSAWLPDSRRYFRAVAREKRAPDTVSAS
jgi:hypothetical protein